MNLFHRLLLAVLPIDKLIKLQKAKLSKGNLDYEFKDELGRKWFTFRDSGEMPVIRLAEQLTHLQYFSSGLTGKSFEQSMEVLTEALAKQDIINAGVIVHDLREIPKKIVNLHALVNIIAVNYVREDEDVETVNHSIHQDKCNWILEQIESGGFFLSLPSSIKQLSVFNLSASYLTDNYHAFQKVIADQRKRLRILRSQLSEKELSDQD